MPEDLQNESHLNFLWMQLFVVGMKRCYVNLLVNSRTKLIQMLVFIWRLQFWFLLLLLWLFFPKEKELVLFAAFVLLAWGFWGVWSLPFARYLCKNSSKCTFSEQFLQSNCILESAVSTLFSTVQFIYIFKRLLLIPRWFFFVLFFFVINLSYFSHVVWSLCSTGSCSWKHLLECSMYAGSP